MTALDAKDDALYPPTVTPSSRALPLLPFLFRFVRNPLRSLPRAVYEDGIVTYGRKRPIVAWITAPDLIEQVLVKRPDLFAKTRLDRRVLRPLVGTGLLTADGEHWRWQRKLAAPLFRPGDVMAYVPEMTAAAQEQIAQWRGGDRARPAAIDIDMANMTFRVLARTVLSGVDADEASEVQRTGYAYIEPIMWSVAAALLLTPETWWFPGRNKMLKAARDSRAVVQRLIDKRRARETAGEDLLGRMLAARHPETGAAMTDDQLVDNLTTFLLAGHETTAKALTWTLYLLARAPQWQEAIRDEVAAVTGGAPLAAGHVAQLHVTQRVLKESMRLYPPVPAMTRVNREAADIGGVHLPEPALIVIPIYAVHRHRKLWADPDRFDPDRFLPEAEARFARTQFMPFGAGARVCVGAAFAMTEATVLLAEVLRAVRVAWDGELKPEPVSRITLHPKGGMRLKLSMVSGAGA